MIRFSTHFPERHGGGAPRVAIALTFAACLVAVAPAQAQTGAAAAPDARAILTRMAEFVSGLKSFSVDVRDSYDTMQKSGQKIEYNETRKLTVARPDRMRLDVVESDGEKQTLTIDAKNITLVTQPVNVYAQTASPGNLDHAIVHFVRDLGMRLPFAVLIVSDAKGELAQRVKVLDYVEKTDILGTPAHHIAGRTDDVDFQVWVADGDKPLPLRLVLTYVKDKGAPAFRAQFSDWNLAPALTEATFSSAPPQGAQRIAFLAELPRAAMPKAASKSAVPGTPAKSGARK